MSLDKSGDQLDMFRDVVASSGASGCLKDKTMLPLEMYIYLNTIQYCLNIGHVVHQYKEASEHIEKSILTVAIILTEKRCLMTLKSAQQRPELDI